MGYYTNFELSFTNLDCSEAELIADLDEVTGYTWSDSFYLGSAKWYGSNDNMREISKKHPDTLFMLSAEGEEQGDLWKAYFKNGKMQMCAAIITFAPFDETKLT